MSFHSPGDNDAESTKDLREILKEKVDDAHFRTLYDRLIGIPNL